MVNKLEEKVNRIEIMVNKLEEKVNRNYGKQILKNQQESKCMILIDSFTSIWWMVLLKTTF